MKTRHDIIFIILIILFGTARACAESPANPAGAATLQSWRDDRLGLFIHWGPVSLTGKEISWSRLGERKGFVRQITRGTPAEEYDNLYKKFNPSAFDAREWVAIAKAAGMKYLVFTSRHHDGFSMFDTKQNDYKITSPLSPFRRDILKEIADACHEGGLKFGIYYSQPDWHHPDMYAKGSHENYVAYLKAQMRELMSNYGKVDILWYDGLLGKAEDYGGASLTQIARDLQPGIIVNNRNKIPEDFDTPEQRIGKYQDDRPWETCMTIGKQWSYKPDDTLKSADDCVRILVRAAGGDGNLLLNVGPMPDGRIEPAQADRLKEIGRWLSKYGESIYKTRGGPWKPTHEHASTRRDNIIYLHILRDEACTLELPPLPVRIKSAKTLDGRPVAFAAGSEKVTFTIAQTAIMPIVTVVRVELDGSAMGIPALVEQIKATSSNNIADHRPINNPGNAFDMDTVTRWYPDKKAREGWVIGEFSRPRTVRWVTITEGAVRGNQSLIKNFEFQCRTGDEEWKTIASGTHLGRDFRKDFDPPVKAREFRLFISSTTIPNVTDIIFSDP